MTDLALPQSPRASSPTAIVVDDDPVVRRTATALFEDAGDAVLGASNVFEAFNIISARPDLKIALIDLQSTGSGGAELAAVIGDMWPSIAVVISGSSPPGEKEAPDDMVFLPRPFGGEELSAAISRAQARQNTAP